MPESTEAIRTLDSLRRFVHRTLCEKENLLEDEFEMIEMPLRRRGTFCGLQFSLNGPRSVRLGAVWAMQQGTIYFYDARGQRYHKERLRCRLIDENRPDAA